MNVEPICIRKVKEPFGFLGNMSPHPIEINVGGVLLNVGRWPTAEHLFQATRFDKWSPVREEIRMQIGPMQAKFVAKKYTHLMKVVPRSEQDVLNMRFVLMLKLEEYPFIKEALLQSGDAFIVEDCSNRPNESGLFWGAAWKLNPESGKHEWVGRNMLGTMWMEIRDKLGKS